VNASFLTCERLWVEHVDRECGLLSARTRSVRAIVGTLPVTSARAVSCDAALSARVWI